jgi:hypothetical protein
VCKIRNNSKIQELAQIPNAMYENFVRSDKNIALLPADHSARGVLLSVVCLNVIEESPMRRFRPTKKKYKNFEVFRVVKNFGSFFWVMILVGL